MQNLRTVGRGIESDSPHLLKARGGEETAAATREGARHVMEVEKEQATVMPT